MRNIVLMMLVSLDGFFEGPERDLDWQTIDVAHVQELKAQPGGDMAVGGADLAAEFLRHDLIDEFRLYVHPVILGRGRRLLPEVDSRIPLQLVETRTFGSGVALLRSQRPDASERSATSADRG
jgi:dihydrofolate reductase